MPVLYSPLIIDSFCIFPHIKLTFSSHSHKSSYFTVIPSLLYFSSPTDSKSLNYFYHWSYFPIPSDFIYFLPTPKPLSWVNVLLIHFFMIISLFLLLFLSVLTMFEEEFHFCDHILSLKLTNYPLLIATILTFNAIALIWNLVI